MQTTLKRAIALGIVAAALSIAGQANAQDSPSSDDLSGSALHVDPKATALPAAPAASFLVADLDTGDILAAQNAHLQRPPASTLKMLTGLTVLPRVNLDSIYTATYDDVAVEGSKVGIVEGSTYTARQLFEGMFLLSGNDAANAVASLNGGTGATVKQMQAQADRLQANDTVVRNPNGLDAPGQVSSAYDLALFARAGLANSAFASFVGTANSTFPIEGTSDPTKRDTFAIGNQNTLVAGGYDGAIGVKSGYTTQAGRTIAAAAERDGHRYLVTMMGITGKTYDTGALYLDWAFQNTGVRPVGSLAKAKSAAGVSDAAVLVPVVRAAATPASAPPATEAAPAPASDESPSPMSFGPWRLDVALITLGACAILRWRLRAQHRRAMRRREPAVRPATIDLRDRYDAAADREVRV